MIMHFIKLLPFLDGKPLRLRCHHVVNLAYVGGRPHRSLRPKFDVSPLDVENNSPLRNWLTKQGLSVDTFVAAVSDHPASLHRRHGSGLLPGRLDPMPSHSQGIKE